MRRALVVMCMLLVSQMVSAQNIKNPNLVEFTSPDHDSDELTGYELDIIRQSDNAVIQTITIPKSSTTKDATTMVVSFVINVQPIRFGTYAVVIRAVANSVKSDTSLPSNAFDRVPGPPSAPRVR